MKIEYQYDPEKGEMIFEGTNVAIIEKRLMAGIQREHEKIIGDSAKRIMYTASKESVEKFFKGFLKFVVGFTGKLTGKRKVFEKMMERSAPSGWGVPSIEEFDEKESKFIFTMKNSFVAHEYGKSTKSVCHFTAGMVAGLLTGLLGKNIDCEEIECIAKGDIICRFIAGPSSD
jgi:predicted hydrocarbon binding protein